MLRTFFETNRAVSRRLERRLPQARVDLFQEYERTVARHMNARPGQLVIDVGGGKSCPFARYRRAGDGTHIIAVDVCADEIQHNRDVDEARVADITKGLPIEPEHADMIVSRSVLEHLESVDAFANAAARALKPGGTFIHLFPSRFAPFAIANRVLPNRLGKRVMHFFHPASVGINGFPAFYDRCSASEIERVVERAGFAVETCAVSYYQSRYYDFFFPAFVLSAMYELIVRAAGIRNLGAYVLIVARKR